MSLPRLPSLCRIIAKSVLICVLRFVSAASSSANKNNPHGKMSCGSGSIVCFLSGLPETSVMEFFANSAGMARNKQALSELIISGITC